MADSEARRSWREMKQDRHLKLHIAMAHTLMLGGQEPFFWEPHIALAVPVQEKQEITVHFGVQGPSGL